ncbi:unnamed protein product [Heterobilharzia americana]|nr:unnamed protein product [Heterobilharzia americana]
MSSWELDKTTKRAQVIRNIRRYERYKHKRKTNFIAKQQIGGNKQIQKQLDCLVLIWSSLGVMINVGDLLLDGLYANKDNRFVLE